MTEPTAASTAKEEGQWVRWFIKYYYSDFWDIKHNQDYEWTNTRVIRFCVPDDMSEEDEAIKAMEIAQDLVGPSRIHLEGCKECMYRDYVDCEHYFGVTKFHFVEKLPSVFPDNDSEQEARECQEKFEAACPKISKARADHKRQQKLAQFKKALVKKEKEHQQEVEELKKRFGVE